MKALDRLVAWLDERTGLKEPVLHMITHPVPPGSTSWAYVFGTSVLTSFIVQIVTGIALSTLYIPSAGEAYESIRYMTLQAPLGSVVRGMHYFGASAMILLIGFHTIRVYLWGAYKYPREVSWITGVVLLFTTVAMGFTGQILRWDQTAIWTVVVGAEQARRLPFLGNYAVQILLSGGSIGTSTLSHMFAMHVFILPAIVISAIAFHLYLVLQNGISEPPVAGDPVDPKTYKKKISRYAGAHGKTILAGCCLARYCFQYIRSNCHSHFGYQSGTPTN